MSARRLRRNPAKFPSSAKQRQRAGQHQLLWVEIYRLSAAAKSTRWCGDGLANSATKNLLQRVRSCSFWTLHPTVLERSLFCLTVYKHSLAGKRVYGTNVFLTTAHDEAGPLPKLGLCARCSRSTNGLRESRWPHQADCSSGQVGDNCCKWVTGRRHQVSGIGGHRHDTTDNHPTLSA